MLTQIPLTVAPGDHEPAFRQLRYGDNARRMDSGLSWTLVPAALAPPPPAVQGTADLHWSGSCWGF
ncbi:MAG: hypothetical protein U0Q15_14600 [Kineosporiaceae bacterium]